MVLEVLRAHDAVQGPVKRKRVSLKGTYARGTLHSSPKLKVPASETGLDYDCDCVFGDSVTGLLLQKGNMKAMVDGMVVTVSLEIEEPDGA